LQIAKEYARQAIDKDPNEPLARCVSALAASYEKDLDRAKTEIDAALALNPNLALAHSLRGNIRAYSGKPLDAIPEIEQAMRLDPALSEQFLHFLGLAYLMARLVVLRRQLLQQRLRLLQIARLEAFSEPAVGSSTSADSTRRASVTRQAFFGVSLLIRA
jgi:adenylate cyclase